jgi:hypothetical protein
MTFVWEHFPDIQVQVILQLRSMSKISALKCIARGDGVVGYRFFFRIGKGRQQCRSLQLSLTANQN